MKATGFMCCPRSYQFNGWEFEFGYCGPWPLKKNGDSRERCGRKFLKDIGPFCNMTNVMEMMK